MNHENFEIIDVIQTNEREVYLVVTSDGRITQHTENHGDAYPHKIDEEIAFIQLRWRNPFIADKVAAALRRLREHVGEDDVIADAVPPSNLGTAS